LWTFLEKRKISCPYCGLSPRVPNLFNKCYTLLLFNKCTSILKRVNVMHWSVTLSLLLQQHLHKKFHQYGTDNQRIQLPTIRNFGANCVSVNSDRRIWD
jgi:hypothetical protein